MSGFFGIFFPLWEVDVGFMRGLFVAFVDYLPAVLLPRIALLALIYLEHLGVQIFLLFIW